jgi:ubiquinone/menaquinone biosynthesis C-methylase UbiE
MKIDFKTKNNTQIVTKMCIEKAYDIWAEQYDTNNNRTRDLDIKATKQTLSKYSFNSVLELGCGTGKNTQWLLTKAGYVLGIDFSKEMLKIAEKKINDERFEYKKADINNKWGIKNKKFDLITSSLTLEHIRNLNHIFTQAHTQLKDNGLFFLCELHPFKQYTGTKAQYETINGTEELEVYTHHTSEYIECAKKNGFKLIEINEWFDDVAKKAIPRLISIVFKKS